MDQLIYLNEHLGSEVKRYQGGRSFPPSLISLEKTSPPVLVTKGVKGDVYDAYRQGLDSACVDIVIATTDKKGEPRVLAIKRGPNKPFANKWWMQGGALHAYVSTLDFVTERAEKECGVRPQIVGLICVARTCAPDFLASTTQPCYLGLVPFEKICVKYDADHSAGRLLGWNDLSHLPTDEQHWYPMFAFKTAINALT